MGEQQRSVGLTRCRCGWCFTQRAVKAFVCCIFYIFITVQTLTGGMNPPTGKTIPNTSQLSFNHNQSTNENVSQIKTNILTSTLAVIHVLIHCWAISHDALLSAVMASGMMECRPPVTLPALKDELFFSVTAHTDRTHRETRARATLRVVILPLAVQAGWRGATLSTQHTPAWRIMQLHTHHTRCIQTSICGYSMDWHTSRLHTAYSIDYTALKINISMAPIQVKPRVNVSQCKRGSVWMGIACDNIANIVEIPFDLVWKQLLDVKRVYGRQSEMEQNEMGDAEKDNKRCEEDQAKAKRGRRAN